jgi:hypothetical protein
MCIILILEISAAAVFLSYKNEPLDDLEIGLNKTVNEINENPNDQVALNIMNTVQTVFKCCGCHGPSDYNNLTMMYSCETKESTKILPIYYQNGCFSTVVSYIRNHLPIVFGLSVTLVLFQIFCLVISARACLSIKREGYEDI